MKKHIVAAALALSVTSFAGVAVADMAGVEGTLSKIEGEYYYVTTKDGKEVKGHFNDKTMKKGDIKVGAMVEIYVDDKGHTTKIEEHKH
jgi:hypothetical protein